MEVLKLSSLIGKEILEIKYQYEYENEWGLSEFKSFLRLSGNIIIDIPMFDDVEFREETPGELSYYRKQFESGKPVSDEAWKKVEGQTIADFFLCYDKDGDLHDLGSGYILLSNGYYLVERNHAPPGIAAGLWILDEKEFNERNSRFDIAVRSFLRSG